jgi:hypothetical protein
MCHPALLVEPLLDIQNREAEVTDLLPKYIPYIAELEEPLSSTETTARVTAPISVAPSTYPLWAVAWPEYIPQVPGVEPIIAMNEADQVEIFFVVENGNTREWKIVRGQTPMNFSRGTKLFHQNLLLVFAGTDSPPWPGHDGPSWHGQGDPQTVWGPIDHGKGTFPGVTVQTTAGDDTLGFLEYIDQNNIQLKFEEPTAGEVFIE